MASTMKGSFVLVNLVAWCCWPGTALAICAHVLPGNGPLGTSIWGNACRIDLI